MMWSHSLYHSDHYYSSYYIFAAAYQPLTGCWGTQVLPPLSRAYVARQDFRLHQEVESTKQHQESPRSTGLAHSTSVQLQFPFKTLPLKLITKKWLILLILEPLRWCLQKTHCGDKEQKPCRKKSKWWSGEWVVFFLNFGTIWDQQWWNTDLQ